MTFTEKLSKAKWLILPVAAVGASVVVLAAMNPSIEAQTSPESADARLRSRHYKANLEDVRASTLEIIPGLRKYGSRWRVIEGESENSIVAEVPVLVFTDQLEVTFSREADFTVVNVHSKSRFPGRSDLGENRRHILQLLAALDEVYVGE